jgi:phage tail-like protein
MDYPLTGFNFQVDWGGARLGFSEVSGLEIAVRPIYYREGNSRSAFPSVMPGLAESTTVVLMRGAIAGDNDFFGWIDSVTSNQIERRDVTISLLDAERTPAATWRVRSAWPIRLLGPQLDASASKVAIELLELAHEGISVVSNG